MTKAEYKKSGEEAKEIEARLNALVRTGWNKILEEKPELAAKYKVQALNVCYHKRPPGSYKIVPKIMEFMLRKGYAVKTQKKILEDVRKALPNQIIHDTIWSRQLKGKELDRIKTIIRGTMDKPLDVAGCKTLSQIKKRLLAAEYMGDEARIIKATFKIDKKTLVAGKDKLFPIIRKKTGQYSYPGVWVDVPGKNRAFLRVDALVTMLLG